MSRVTGGGRRAVQQADGFSTSVVSESEVQPDCVGASWLQAEAASTVVADLGRESNEVVVRCYLLPIFYVARRHDAQFELRHPRRIQ